MNDTVRTPEESIHLLYEQVLNHSDSSLLGEIVHPAYQNEAGQGPDAFYSAVAAFRNSFPDAQWIITDIAENDTSVMVRQEVTGTHLSTFNDIPPTGARVSAQGMAVYHFKDGKIISHQVITDRLGFLNQLKRKLPTESTMHVVLVDRFEMPEVSREVFYQQANINRAFIRKIPGFIGDKLFESAGNDGKLIVLTIAEWTSMEKLDSARKAVRQHYANISLDMQKFLESNGISMQRDILLKK